MQRPFWLGVFATLAAAFLVTLLFDVAIALAIGLAALASAVVLLRGTGLTRLTPLRDDSPAARRARRAAWASSSAAGASFLAGSDGGGPGGCSGGSGGGCGGGGCGGGN